MPIERGHEHYLQPISAHTFEDGAREYKRQCVCGLEEKRLVGQDDLPLSLRYRYNGMWFEPLDILRLAPIPVEECVRCSGSGIVIDEEPTRCGDCGGLGVTEDGQLVGKLAFTQN